MHGKIISTNSFNLAALFSFLYLYLNVQKWFRFNEYISVQKKIVGKNFEINGENKFFKNGWRVFLFLSNDLWVGLRFCNQITMLTKSIRDIN